VLLVGNEFPPTDNIQQRLSNIAGTKTLATTLIWSTNRLQLLLNQSNGVLEAAFMRANRCFCEQHNPTVNKASGVTIQNDGIHVDLSQEFTTGSASMSSRVAQVLYTATSLQPNAKVWIESRVNHWRF